MGTRVKKSSHEPEVNHDERVLFLCAELILPWLNPHELASISLTCKFLNTVSRSISARRSSDASRTFEKFPIPFINTVDNIPYCNFIYTPSLITNSTSQRQLWGSSSAFVELSRFGSVTTGFSCGPGGDGCDCDSCGEEGDGAEAGGENECPCRRLRTSEMMSECGRSCGCASECGNRLTQRGVSVRVKVVRDARKGWGLRALETIRVGQFVCEYAGELLTTKEARRRQTMYDELSLDGQFSSALLVVREHLPSGKACLRINIDATRIGNVARFINHSCDGGNLSTILVRTSGDLFPRLCFFASRDINKEEELTFSYGEIRISSKGLQCFCGSSCCLGILPSEQT